MAHAKAVPGLSDQSWVVLKFGGSSVSKSANWPYIESRIRQNLDDGKRVFVVISALSDVSNQLESIVAASEKGVAKHILDALYERHLRLISELGLHDLSAFELQFESLRQEVARKFSGNTSVPKMHASIVSHGELLSTAIGYAHLLAQGLDIASLDARSALVSVPGAGRSELQNSVSAVCNSDKDDAFRKRLAAGPAVVLTQGFIAADADGNTVLLGREGSDTSAAYFAAKLQAAFVEIWTDVPGMFSADPRLVPSARLLKRISFEEAQELASTGSKVLHPRCLSPVRRAGIPMYIRCTGMPENPGTCISTSVTDTEPQVKGLSMRSGVTLLSMQSAAMWHEVGFLATAFACFQKHGVSIDLVSTSETNVTVTIDVAEDLVPNVVLASLVAELGKLCRVRVIENCAVVSLVGRQIRTILPKLAPALTVFEEEKIHLVSQAANDLNLSFVIDGDQAQRLLVKLHSSVIRKEGGAELFGPSWQQIQAGDLPPTRVSVPWWKLRRDDLLSLCAEESSAYVYDLETVRRAAKGLTRLDSIDRVLYALKANNNPDVVRELVAQGVDFDCVSPGEVARLRHIVPTIDAARILYTPNFAPKSEYRWAIEQGLQLTLDNLYPLQAWPELFSGQSVFIRIDPGTGRGHHDHVKTAGNHSKFGVPLFEMDELRKLTESANCTVVGLHAHTGSGILDPDNWNLVAESLAAVAERFPSVRVLDLGGGLGVPEKTGDEVFDLAELDGLLTKFRTQHPQFQLWIEPGRFLVAQAGVLLSRVTQTKGKGDRRYVGICTGMNSLIRPALYGAYHEIVNLTRIDEEASHSVTVVGPICESGDKLGSDRLLPESVEGDVILIANAGAYGRVMASNYNLREIAPELVLGGEGR